MAVFAKEAYAAGVSVPTLLALRFALAARRVLGHRRRRARRLAAGAPRRRLIARRPGARRLRLRARGRRLLRRALAHGRVADVAAALHLPRARVRRGGRRSAASAPTAPRVARARGWPAPASPSSSPAAASGALDRLGVALALFSAVSLRGLRPGHRPHRRRASTRSRLGALVTTGAAGALLDLRPAHAAAWTSASPRRLGVDRRARAGLDRRRRSATFTLGLRPRRARDGEHRLERRARRHRRPGRWPSSASAWRRCSSPGGALVLAAVILLQLRGSVRVHAAPADLPAPAPARAAAQSAA